MQSAPATMLSGRQGGGWAHVVCTPKHTLLVFAGLIAALGRLSHQAFRGPTGACDWPQFINSFRRRPLTCCCKLAAVCSGPWA